MKPDNPLKSFSEIAHPTSIPVSACIPPRRLCSDLITARVYACVVGQGGGMDGQPIEIE
jgi:hypothetical protein